MQYRLVHGTDFSKRSIAMSWRSGLPRCGLCSAFISKDYERCRSLHRWELHTPQPPQQTQVGQIVLSTPPVCTRSSSWRATLACMCTCKLRRQRQSIRASVRTHTRALYRTRSSLTAFRVVDSDWSVCSKLSNFKMMRFKVC